MAMFKSNKTLASWLTDYAVSHRNPTNKKIHFVCVPVIFLTIVALFWLINPFLLLAVALGVLWFYARLSWSLFIAMSVFVAICVAIVASIPIHFGGWIAVFVLAWIGQFIGHKIEGAKPSFFEDVQFLLIGPAWVALSLIKKPINK
ncbi:Mpo1 family 2-hydroxy fatty acid dioxygenase [Moraxella macacae]|nr:Mpo1-like protein [Moraxella macacae]